MWSRPEQFTYPFRYTPREEIVAASRRLIARMDADSALSLQFGQGKMMGVLEVEVPRGCTDPLVVCRDLCDGASAGFLFAYSGFVGNVPPDVFVPPVYDIYAPDGYYRRRESEISACGDPAAKSVMSAGLQDWIFSKFVMLNARGESLGLKEVFALKGLVPPGGAGECAAPRLLQYAYGQGYRPLAMGEFWYGAQPAGQPRRQGCFYPSCTGKCGPLLDFMLRGLDVEPDPLLRQICPDGIDILYEDDHIIVADKPSGMLSAPGRSTSLRTAPASLEEWLSLRYGGRVLSCHRLDMDTAGLMVYARDRQTQAALQQQFAERSVRKEYLALLCPGHELPSGGLLDLPLLPDWYERPRQCVNFDCGKPAVTGWEKVRECAGGYTLVRFFPQTGRTHQLRVHAASAEGLGRPIVGDALYGGGHVAGFPVLAELLRSCGFEPDCQLALRAVYLSFRHPGSGAQLEFRSACGGC